MRALAGRNDRRVADQRVVNTRIRDQVGLELVQIDVKRTVETQGRGDRADNLGDQAVEVLVARARNVKVATADVVDSLVVDEESAVGVLNRAVGRQDGVIRLNDGGRHTGGRVNGELQLALLAILGGEALEEEGTETRASTTTKGVEDQETLQRAAVVCCCCCKPPRLCEWARDLSVGPSSRLLTSNTSNAVNDIVNHLLADGVVPTGIVVGGILLSTDQELRVVEMAVATGADLINRGGVEVDEDGSRHVFAIAGLGEECLVRATIGAVLEVGVRTTIRAKAVLEEVAGMED